MQMSVANIEAIKRCAFCQYWYDPTNEHIKPKEPKINLWEYDKEAKCKCLKRRYDMRGNAICPDYEIKLTII